MENENQAEIKLDVSKPKQKGVRSTGTKNASGSREMPKQALVSVRGKRKTEVEDEFEAIRLTHGVDEYRANRRLTDFIFHDVDGEPQPVETLEVKSLFISGCILPLEGSSDQEKEKGVRCECFGRVESWAISGYDEGAPVIWVSTAVADYECVNPGKEYETIYRVFFEKARACIEIYTTLTSRRNPNLNVDELLARVVRSMSDSKNFTCEAEIKDFIVSKGEFIYNELVGLDDTPETSNLIFRDLPELKALRDDARRHRHFVPPEAISRGLLTPSWVIDDTSYANGAEEGVDATLARLLQEQEYGRSSRQKKGQCREADLASYASDAEEDGDAALARLLQEQEYRRSSRHKKGIAKESEGLCKFAASQQNQKRAKPTNTESPFGSPNMPKKRQVRVHHEVKAITMTSEEDDPRPNRRLTNFVFHDAEGNPQALETLEAKFLFTSGLILPLEEISEEQKEMGVRCKSFGHVDSWAISGYEEGSPVIWISTEAADYECVNPAKGYEKQYYVFFEKARACVEVYMKLSRTCGGNPNLSLEELLVHVAQSMSNSENFTCEAEVQKFIGSEGKFIYNELIGLDEMSSDEKLGDLPVLAALRDNAKNLELFVPPILKVGDREQVNDPMSSAFGADEDEELKSARFLLEEENWRSTIQKRVEHEVEAINLTCGQEDGPQSNRRLTNFIFHDDDGKPQCLEKLEVDVLYISGLILPLEENSENKKQIGVRCEGFGRVESWAISGYEESSPIIWISTEVADYECVSPAKGYEKLYNTLFEKARVCVEVYTKLSTTRGGNPNLSLDDLLGKVVQSMRSSENCRNGDEIRGSIVSWGEFIYNELVGLDETSSDQMFRDLPVLVSLAKEAKKHRPSMPKRARSHKFGDREEIRQSGSSASGREEDEDEKSRGADELPRSMLHNWSLYDSYSQLISLELLPMRSCSDDSHTIFGSGVMTVDDDGSGLSLDDDSNLFPSASAGAQNVDGIPIYLSTIRDWMVEFKSSMIFVSIRTDTCWYRLGKPSKQYAPLYEQVLKTGKLGASIILLLKEQTRVARLSFADVIRRLSQFRKNHPTYISRDPAEVEMHVLIHGQMILRQFAEYPEDVINRCAFVTALRDKMVERDNLKWLAKKRTVANNNLAETEAASPMILETKAMPATKTELVNRIWREHHSSQFPEDSDEVDVCWDGESAGKTSSGNDLYKRVIVCGHLVTVGGYVKMEGSDDDTTPIYLVEYMFENSDSRKMFHGRLMLRGSQTVIGNAGNEREVFLTNECRDLELCDVQEPVSVEIKTMPWGHQHRKANADKSQIDNERAKKRKRKRLSTEYYCKSLYWPERGAFFCLPSDTMGLGNGACRSCVMKETEKEKDVFKVDPSLSRFVYKGTEYCIHDFVYVAPHHFGTDEKVHDKLKGCKNVGLKAYVICHLLEITVTEASEETCPKSTCVKVRRFFRPEDISASKAYGSDIREVYYSEQLLTVPVIVIEGKCEVGKKSDLQSLDGSVAFRHTFYCEHLYDPHNGGFEELPSHITLSSSKEKQQMDTFCRNPLATLDIFAGCGGLSEGLQRAGASLTKWAIEYEEPAGKAFSLNHPEALMFINNCNVILRAIMSACGDTDDCVSTYEADELAAKLDKKVIKNLPRPGQVEFINGGPPCQGFSGLNRFSQSRHSKVQCEMILAYLSFADYFRPKFFLLENVRNFVSFDKGKTFRLTLALLLEMGYQVRFGILDAGAYGLPQSRRRVFIWAASPEETLPEWPEPMHVFGGRELKVTLSESSQYAAVRSTEGGAPFRSITVRDAIGDLPVVENGASAVTMRYENEPVSWFQKQMQGDGKILNDHISKSMNELNLIRCQRIPKRPGADWRDLPTEEVELSTGLRANLVPTWVPNTAQRHNHWKGVLGRLCWEGNFLTSLTDPQPEGIVGMCFHPDQDRILTVRECARSQGFPDSYKFSGNIQHKHKQVGNAVPPPLAYALGRMLKEAVGKKHSLTTKFE